MYPDRFDYVAPDSLEGVLDALAEDPEARVLAGGQSLVPLLKLRLAAPSRLVDLRKLDGLREVREEDDHLEVGAMARHAEVARWPALEGGARALAEAAASVGDLQVRNLGTLGGSLAHADPSADLPAAALALEAELVARGPEGERTIPAEEFFLGLWTTALQPGEVLTRVRVPRREGAGGAYAKLTHKASGFAVVGAAAVVEAEDGVCRRARVALTGAGTAPLRLPAVEEALEGEPLEEEAVEAACRGAGDAVESPQEDLQGSADYRRAMAGVMAKRAVLRAAGG